MVDILLGSLATIITVPVLAWIIVYWLVKKITHHKKRSFLLATDVTTFFLIISVLVITYTLWHHSFLWPLIIVLLAVVISITWIFWKQDKDVELFKIMKTAWRFNFLLFFSGYILLCLYGLIQSVMEI